MAERKSVIRTHFDLEVYQLAFTLSMEIFEHSKSFPRNETFSLVDQMRRSSRSVCANLAEAWRKRRYEAAFISKLGDSEAEAAETQTWIQFAVECQYLTREQGRDLFKSYDSILAMLVDMIRNSDKWILR